MKPDEIMEEAVAEKQSHLFKPTLPIKETVEEAAKKYTESNTDRNRAYGMVYSCFINGANWQKQKTKDKLETLKSVLTSWNKDSKYTNLLDLINTML